MRDKRAQVKPAAVGMERRDCVGQTSRVAHAGSHWTWRPGRVEIREGDEVKDCKHIFLNMHFY